MLVRIIPSAVLILASSRMGFSTNMLCPHESFTFDYEDGLVKSEIIGTMTAVHENLILTLDDGGSLGGRSYLGETCKTVKKFEPTDYLAIKLADKVISWDVDLQGAECGCNVAFYLTPMRWNEEEGSCGDYYCDANAVCGVRCTEIDLMEANMYAFHSTLHNASDNAGIPGGYGGGGLPKIGDEGWNGPRDFDGRAYGPTNHSKCIDTSKPFKVSAAFPLDPATGLLRHMAMTLSQEALEEDGGAGCALNFTVGDAYPHKHEMTRVLSRGVTPILSYWSGEMAWLDGVGADGLGPCTAAQDHISVCNRHTSIANIEISDLHAVGDDADGSGDDKVGDDVVDDDDDTAAADDDKAGGGGGDGGTAAGSSTEPTQGAAPVALIVLIVVGGSAAFGICAYQLWDVACCINARDGCRAFLGVRNKHHEYDERAVGGFGGGGGGLAPRSPARRVGGGAIGAANDSAASLGGGAGDPFGGGGGGGGDSRRRSRTRESFSGKSPSRRSRSRSISRDANGGDGSERESGELSAPRRARRASRSPARRSSRSPARRASRSPQRKSQSLELV